MSQFFIRSLLLTAYQAQKPYRAFVPNQKRFISRRVTVGPSEADRETERQTGNDPVTFPKTRSPKEFSVDGTRRQAPSGKPEIPPGMCIRIGTPATKMFTDNIKDSRRDRNESAF